MEIMLDDVMLHRLYVGCKVGYGQGKGLHGARALKESVHLL